MADARNRFSIGDTVKLSPLGLHHLGRFSTRDPRFSYTAELRGIVVGFSRRPGIVRVRRVGLKGAESYVHEFWAALLPAPPETTER